MAMNLCVTCKGKGLCGRERCPILTRFEVVETIAPADSLFGASPPSVFVGRKGYPDIFAGPLVPPNVGGSEARHYDDPKELLERDIGEIIGLRSQLVRSYTRMNVKDAKGAASTTKAKNAGNAGNEGISDNPTLLTSQELAMAELPVDTEVWFTRPLNATVAFDGMLMPMGPAGEIKKITLTENPKVPRKVDYLISDTDSLAADAIRELYRNKVSQHHITRIFSIGLLGTARKLVPTRWSITAIDNMIGKMLLDNVRDYPEVRDITLFTAEKFGNHFEILLIPRCFSFELVEIWLPDSVWSEKLWIGSDREEYSGKKGYSSLAGGYYAARTSVIEYLHAIRRQASVVIVREILPDYWAPLGVWVVREAAREALRGGGVTFESVDSALREISSRVRTPYSEWKGEIQLLDKCRYQRTIGEFV